MIDCISESSAKPGFLLLVLSVAISISACANTAAIHEEERAHYEALENELIGAQQAEERLRRIEMQVAQKTEQLESEPAVDAHRQLRTPSEPMAEGNEDAKLSQEGPRNLSSSGPADTQITIDQASNEISGIWTLQHYPSPIDGSALCAVVSPPAIVTNGTIDTLVAVIISNSAVFLRTDASFDTTAAETGYRIDAGIPIGFDHFLNELTAVVDDGYERLTNTLLAGETLKVTFAYSPQLSSDGTHAIEYSLDDIEQTMSELTSCDG